MQLDFPDDDSVLLNGRRYVTARKLAEEYKLSPRYVAWLALEYKVESERLGRLWYIYPPSLQEYLRESKMHWREAMEHEEEQKKKSGQ
jgi:hypothetical protein